MPNKSFGLYYGFIHIDRSLKQAGYLLNYLNYVIWPFLNWSENLLSVDQNSLTSGILNNLIANLYSPRPAAQPLSFPLPALSSTLW
jgi:hypothetical protein